MSKHAIKVQPANEIAHQNIALPMIGHRLAEEWSFLGNDAFLENMRLMATRLQNNDEFKKRISITSALSGEGVTTVCLGLGIIFANDYQEKTCIVDLNWYSPSKFFPNGKEQPGIAELVQKGLPVEVAIRSTGIPGLDILPSGQIEDYKRPVLARNKSLDLVLEELDEKYERIILDVPALLTTSDAAQLAAYGQTTCVVIRQGVTSIQDVKMALDDVSKLNILGVVVNRMYLSTPTGILKLLGE